MSALSYKLADSVLKLCCLTARAREFLAHKSEISLPTTSDPIVKHIFSYFTRGAAGFVHEQYEQSRHYTVEESDDQGMWMLYERMQLFF